MNIKPFLLKKKKIIISCIACFLIGTAMSTSTNASDEEISTFKARHSEIVEQVSQKDSLLESKREELAKLQSTTSELENKKDEIEKAEQEKLAKEQEKQENAERLAKEKAEKEEEKLAKEKQKQIAKDNEAKNNQPSNKKPSNGSGNKNNNSVTKPVGDMVWKTATGKKYHRTNNCGNTNLSNASQISQSDAEAKGLGPCSKCY